MEKPIKDLISASQKSDSIVAVILFGSHARKEAGPLSDTDVCIVAPGISQKVKLDLQSYASAKIDILFFDDLPLNIKVRVIQEGKVLLMKDKRRVDTLSWLTLKEYFDYKIHQTRLIETYLPGVSYV